MTDFHFRSIESSLFPAIKTIQATTKIILNLVFLVVTADLTRNIQRFNEICVLFFIICKSTAGKNLRYYTCTVTLRMKATVSWAKKGHFCLLHQKHIANLGHGMNLAVLFIHSAVCLTTGPELLPKRTLHIVRSRASTFQ